LEVYLNLARRMTLTAIDQLWVADITYIRLKAEFVYLAVILDSVSPQSGGLGVGSDAGEPAGDHGTPINVAQLARGNSRLAADKNTGPPF
jgi:hypothetical protein